MKMKEYCIVNFLFLLLLLFIDKIANFRTENLLQNSLENKIFSFDDIMEYLALNEEKNNIIEDENHESEINLLEKKASTNERGKGCEAMNLCSGKGTCSNGSCVCDEGFDYFDCSVNLMSKN